MSSKASIMAIVLALATCAWAEEPYEVAWTAQFGTSSQYGCYSVATDATGNIYVSGGTRGDLGEPNAGETDAFLSKFSSDGNMLWTTQIGTENADWGRSAAVSPLGDIYVSGWTSGDLGGPNLGDSDVFLSKFGADGSLLWTKQVGTAEWDDSDAVAVDASGSAYVCGVTAGDLGGPNAGSMDAFLCKFGADGDLLWTKQIGTSAFEGSSYVDAGASGNIYDSRRASKEVG